LTWWRKLPPDAFCYAERSLLVATLENISVLHGDDDVAAAMRGDAAAAIHAALVVMPIEEITLRADVTLTALMRTALDGDAASASVMAQIVGLSNVGHEVTHQLAASWLSFGTAKIRRGADRAAEGIRGPSQWERRHVSLLLLIPTHIPSTASRGEQSSSDGVRPRVISA
jgi:hypothetical protein